MLLFRFLTLVVVLNVLRYVIGGFLIEPLTIFAGLSAAMQESADYFNSEFNTFD